MAAGLIYEMQFKNVEDVLVRVLIGDTSVPESDNPVIKQLQPAGTPLLLSTIDNEEMKFNPIRSQQATITFLSDEDNSLNNFSDGPDDRFNVTVYYGAQVIFYGFLSLNDNQEAFIAGSNEVTLTANDKLAALKDIPLTDFDGENPQGKYTIGHLVAMCLQKTGLSLPIKVMHNLKHGSGQREMLATFTNSPIDQIIVSNSNGSFFYPGQVLTISGTTSNNITTTVLDVAISFISLVAVSDNLTNESETNATFTDVTDQQHFYNHYLDAKTFEEEIGVSINCYEVLEKILGYDCFIIQHKGAWWIMRVDEFDNFGMYVANFDEDGEFINIYEENSLNKPIGYIQEHWLSDESTSVSPIRPVKFAKLVYNFEYPQEIVCNQDFERGDFIQDLPDEQIEGITYNVKKYALDCWTNGQYRNNTPDPVAASSGDYYIKRFFIDDYEKLRYVVLGVTSETGPYRFIRCEKIKLSVKDKGTVSVDFKFSPVTSDNNVLVLGLVFFGTSGTSYLTGDASNGNWFENPNPFPSTSPGTNSLWVDDYLYSSAEEKESFQTMSFEFGPVPENGDLYIYLGSVQNATREIYFNNLQFDYQPYTNGSYRVYRGRHEKVTRDADGYIANVDDEVFVSDAERELFKGALFYFNNPNYYLTQRWYPANRYALGYPSDTEFIKPFGWHQAYAVWNQYRLANRVFQMQSQGFGSDIPHPVHKFAITDFSPHSINRYFLMITFEKDLFLCNMTATLEQVYHLTEGKSYDDPHEFKYIS